MIRRNLSILWVIITFVIIFNVSATENNCCHVDYTEIFNHTEYSQITYNDREHYVIQNYDIVCDNCTQTLHEKQSAKADLHDFKGNTCLSCNYER